MKIKKVIRGKNHWYIDQDDGDRRIPGVTTITKNGLPAPQLMNWAGDATAEYAIDNWEELADLPISERLRRLKHGRYDTRDAAADKGRLVHNLAERLSRGETVSIPAGLEGYVNSCVRFLDEYQFQPIHTEAVVYNETRRYCGQIDAYGRLLLPDSEDFEEIPCNEDGFSRALIDYKTSRSGIFGETGYQLTGYRHCEWLILPDGEITDMPEVDVCLGVHITPRGYTVTVAKTDAEAFTDFLYIKEMARIADKDEKAGMISDALTFPDLHTFKLIRTDQEEL